MHAHASGKRIMLCTPAYTFTYTNTHTQTHVYTNTRAHTEQELVLLTYYLKKKPHYTHMHTRTRDKDKGQSTHSSKKDASVLKMKRSRRMLGSTPGRCTFTATSSPVSFRTARYTCTHKHMIIIVLGAVEHTHPPTHVHLHKQTHDIVLGAVEYTTHTHPHTQVHLHTNTRYLFGVL